MLINASKQPLISICLPVYNGEQYLAAAIESALNQTLQDFELIISDDCSTDQSAALIEEYAAKDKRIKYLQSNQRAGLFANYNKCMAAAKGTFIKPHAQDDVFEPELLARLHRVMESHPDVALVSSARHFIDRHGCKIHPGTFVRTVEDFLGEQDAYKAVEVSKCSLIPLLNFIGEPCTVMFRSEHKGDGFDTQFRHLGDIEYWLRLMEYGDYAYVNEPLVSFRQHRTSATATNKANLWIAADIVKMSRACEHVLRKVGGSRTSFVRDNLLAFSLQVNLLLGIGELSEESLFGDPLMKDEDAVAIKEALYHLLFVAADLHRQLYSSAEQTQSASIEMQKVIRNSENLLRSLLRSPSWVITRGLREINRIAGASYKAVPRNLSKDGSVDELQNDYLRYLKSERKKILQSRSWRLTRAFRQFLKGMQKSVNEVLPEKEVNWQAAEHESLSNDSTTALTPSSSAMQSESNSRARRKDGYAHELTVGAMFRDEAPYLAEWIEFHHMLGVEKFFLFNNESQDDFEEVLAPYIRKNLVVLCHWPMESRTQAELNNTQCGAYRRIVDMNAGLTKWLALIDIDEFVFPVVQDSLLDVLHDYEDFGGLSVNWQMFGTGGCSAIPKDKLLIESLNQCSRKNHRQNHMVKTISRPDLIMHFDNVHFATYVPGKLQVNADKIPMKGSFSGYVSTDKIRVNHYWSRDEITFASLKKPRLKHYNFDITEAELNQWLSEFNETKDTAIHRFVPELRQRVFNCPSTR